MNAETWCSSCGAGLRTVMTVGGRRRELEVEPHPDGNHVLVDVPVVGGGTGTRVRVLTGSQMPAQGPAHRAHQCPDDVKSEPGPRCVICRKEMTRDIALEQGWTTHPSCEPEFQAWITRERRQHHERAARARRTQRT